MPQMYPMNWLLLFSVFNLTFLAITTLLYPHQAPIITPVKKSTPNPMKWMW